MGIEDVSKIDLIDRPDQASFLSAFKILIKLDAIDPITARLTKTGKEMSVLPTEPIYSRLLIAALKPQYRTIKGHITSIVSMLSVESIFFSSKDNEVVLAKKRRKLMNGQSDHITLLNIFNAYSSILKTKGRHQVRQFCKEFGINERSVAKAGQIKSQLEEYLT